MNFTEKTFLLSQHLPSSVQVKENLVNLCNVAKSKSYQSLPTYNFWRGWWKEDPRNIVEETLKVLWEGKINVDFYREGGIEYWSRCFENHGSLEWHQDTCEDHYADKNKKYEIANYSQVYYVEVSDNLEGGVLEINPYRHRVDLKTHDKFILNLDSSKIERIKPENGRTVFMDSAQSHRVTKITQGIRKNLSSSFWLKTPNFYKKHENWDLEFNEEGKHILKKVKWKDKYSMDFVNE